MKSHLNQYIEASGVRQDQVSQIRSSFEDIIRKMPNISIDPLEATIQIKKFLFRNGFSYQLSTFNIQDVLSKQGGNCLGLPVFIGTIMGELGFNPKYRIVVNPADERYKGECILFNSFNEEIPYHTPELATEYKYPYYFFAPLEHLVLDVDGGLLLETTTEEHEPTIGKESSEQLSFEEALSCIYKDRAVNSKDNQERRSLIQKGLELWKNNSQLYSLLIRNELLTLDDKIYEEALRDYDRTRRNDSLHSFDLFCFTGDKRFLEETLRRYPSHAQAIAADANLSQDSNEARFGFALASQCYANSAILDLGNFYTMYAERLAQLFGKERIVSVLRSFYDEKVGDFNYHLTLYKLTGDLNQFGEAEEAIETPYDQDLFEEYLKINKIK
ncbi:hypothetical protein J4406_02695 [Candidatus Woesearchaeota archaeon]|nr:hypothetical protein [Candidatus Woesearchaeota archaeon]